MSLSRPAETPRCVKSASDVLTLSYLIHMRPLQRVKVQHWRYTCARRICTRVYQCWHSSICLSTTYVQNMVFDAWPVSLTNWQSCTAACNSDHTQAAQMNTQLVTHVTFVCTCVPAQLSACAYMLMLNFICTSMYADVHVQHPYVHSQCSQD